MVDWIVGSLCGFQVVWLIGCVVSRLVDQFVGQLVGRLVYWLVAWSAGLSAVRSVGLLDDRSISKSAIVCSVGQLVVIWSVCWSVGWMVHRALLFWLVSWFVGQSIGRWIGLLIGRFVFLISSLVGKQTSRQTYRHTKYKFINNRLVLKGKRRKLDYKINNKNLHQRQNRHNKAEHRLAWLSVSAIDFRRGLGPSGFRRK